MSTISVHDSLTFRRSSVSPQHVIVVFDSPAAAAALTDSRDPVLRQTIGLVGDADLALIQATASSLTQGTDAASKADCHFLVDGQLLRVSLVLLPSACSRHNAPSRCHALGAAVKDVKGSKSTLVVIVVDDEALAFAQLIAAGRQFPLFSLTAKQPEAQAVSIVAHFPLPSCTSSVAQLITSSEVTIRHIRLAQQLVDTPPNLLHCDAYVSTCRELAAAAGCGLQVIQGRDLEAAGLGGLWGVGKAAEHLPALVILSHYPEGCSAETEGAVCLVGKGIVYDTGGLSIKTPTTSMAGMKTDMGGSAAVLGAFLTAVADTSSHPLVRPLHALLCIAENAVGPLATRPDDIHRLLSGKTVEVNNTDAEGRLVLADGCCFAAQRLKASVIIDIATLTGAQLIATGKRHAAIYCNDEALEAQAVAAGRRSGDLVHPVPYAPELFRNEFRSSVADMKNSVADRGNAQVSCAAQFIGNHLEAHLLGGGLRWLHVDMAGPCNNGERATGYGVALLFDLVCGLNKQ